MLRQLNDAAAPGWLEGRVLPHIFPVFFHRAEAQPDSETPPAARQKKSRE